MSKNPQIAEQQILSPEMAFFHAVRAYPGGVPAMAATIWMDCTDKEKKRKANTLQNKLNPTQDTHKLTLAEAMDILALTRDKRILDAICSQVGAVWVWADDVKPSGDMEVFSTGSTLVRRASGLLDELESALDDGSIDADEMAAIQKKLYRLNQAGAGVVEVAKQYQERA